MRNGHIVGSLALALLTAACQIPNSASTIRAADAQSQVQDDARTRDLYLSVIEQLVQYEKYHAALAHIDEFERRFGPNPRSHALRGDAWLALGELAKAEKEYGSVLHGPLSGAGHHGLGSVAGARGNWTLAATHYEAAVHEQPTNTRYLTDLARAYSELGRDRDADFALKKAQELSPQPSANVTRVSASIEKPATTETEHDP